MPRASSKQSVRESYPRSTVDRRLVGQKGSLGGGVGLRVAINSAAEAFALTDVGFWFLHSSWPPPAVTLLLCPSQTPLRLPIRKECIVIAVEIVFDNSGMSLPRGLPRGLTTMPWVFRPVRKSFLWTFVYVLLFFDFWLTFFLFSQVSSVLDGAEDSFLVNLEHWPLIIF